MKCTILLLAASLLTWGQNTSSSVKGTITDPSGAVVVGAACTLTNEATGQAATAPTQSDGGFVFTTVLPGTYKLTVSAPGFKALTIEKMSVSQAELRTLGTLTLNVGESKETVTVTGQTVALQLGSAEKSGIVTGSQLGEIAIKGRDLMSFLSTIPGVVDTSGGSGREALDPNGAVSITINGNSAGTKNVTVDGMNVIDTGNNTGMHYEPNMDAVAEVKVLTSNYQAEYGRQGGGAITMITKGGSQTFHGSAYDFYRHESLNANDFFSNRTGTSKSPYRYRITGWSLGGPVFIPNHFNKAKDKVFFFFSQEMGGIKLDRGFRTTNMPTALERGGNFSQSFDTSGALIVIKDPTTGAAFPNNIIPKERINAKGQAVLNAYPLPNYVDPDPKGRFNSNYKDSAQSPYPKRQEIWRTDINITQKMRFYYRGVVNFDEQANYYGNWPSGAANYKLVETKYGLPGWGHVGSLTWTLSPTFVSETSFGVDHNGIDLAILDTAPVQRAKWGNLPKWYTIEAKAGVSDPSLAPNIVFGGQPVNPPGMLGSNVPWKNVSRNWPFIQNMTKIIGSHQIKFGAYIEFIRKSDPTPANYTGTYNFARNTLNPNDTNNAYSNAILGNFNQYSEANGRPETISHMWSDEFYVQDNWRISRRVTLDFGMRFYHWGPAWDEGQRQATWAPALWDPKQAPSLYVPALNAQGKRVAKNPITGALEPTAVLIGKFVPNSGNILNGIAIGGKTPGVPRGIEIYPGLVPAPRVGFAWDVFGDGNTAVRGGFGIGYSRISTGVQLDMGAVPPAVFTPVSYYGNLDTVASDAGALGPFSFRSLLGANPLPMHMSMSFGIQQRVKSIALEVSYVGTQNRHQHATTAMNPIPMFAHFDPANADPTVPGGVLQDDFLRPYKGIGNVTLSFPQMSTNYNSLQVSANRRLGSGLQFGLAYTFSKALGATATNPYFDTHYWSYGPLGQDRSQNFVFNYIYDVPKLGKKYNSKALAVFADNWQISGITSMISGSPFTPGFSTTDGADITGSAVGARIVVTGDPTLSKSEKSFYRVFDTSVWARPAKGTFGNAAGGLLRGPGINNWDIAVTKRFPLGREATNLQFRGELFNAFNHTQFSSVNSNAQFNAAGVQTNALFGSYSGSRQPRIVQFSLRLQF
ncbi:MAG: carboxypeptidase regulatory-like domain-containing protein [Candidatus Solibacter sp.]